MCRSVEVLGHVFGDDGGIGIQQIKIADAHAGGNFEAYMQQLAQAAVVSRIAGDVAQGGSELFGGPARTSPEREAGGVDVDDVGVRRTKLVAVRVSLGVNFLGQRQTVAAGFSQADQFLKPVVPAVLDGRRRRSARWRRE